MKKLKLTAFPLGGPEILSRQQLRNVLGGNVLDATTRTSTKQAPCGHCDFHGSSIACSGTGPSDCKGCGTDCGIA